MNPTATAYLFDTFASSLQGTYLVQTSSPTSLADNVDDGKDFWNLSSWSPDGTRYARRPGSPHQEGAAVSTFHAAGGTHMPGCG
jgi:hypothetical protein